MKIKMGKNGNVVDNSREPISTSGFVKTENFMSPTGIGNYIAAFLPF